MKSWSSREIIRILEENGWYEITCVGDHHQFKHPTKPGKVTVTHPVKDIPKRTVKSIGTQADIDFEQWAMRRSKS